jgi:DHA2 family multidrug resistance protein
VLGGKIDARLLIALGFAGSALALYSMTRFDAQIDYATIAWARICQSLALTLLFIPINTTALGGMPRAKSNNASAIINMTRNLGGSFGISVVTTLISRREQYHRSVLVAHVSPLSDAYTAALRRLEQAYLAYSGSAVDALRQAEAQVSAMVQKQATLLSFNDCFWAMAVVMAAMLPVVLLMRRPAAGAGPRGH